MDLFCAAMMGQLDASSIRHEGNSNLLTRVCHNRPCTPCRWFRHGVPSYTYDCGGDG